MLKNMRSRNPSGAFCHNLPAHEILESPEVLPAVFIFREKKISPNCHFETEGDHQRVDAPYFTNVKRVLSDIVGLR
jgi:hypothetical protein